MAQQKGHKLTQEDRAKGGRNRAAVMREQNRTLRDRLAEKAQDRADAIETVFLEAMKATVPVFNNDGECVGERPDHATRVRATQAYLAECFGRPAMAITGPGGGPIRFTEETQTARERLNARVVDLAAAREARAGS